MVSVSGEFQVEPAQRRQFGILPAGHVESRHLIEHRRCRVGAARLYLVALDAADDVLEQEREPSGVRLDLGGVHGGDAGGDATCDLAGRSDLYLVGPEREARAAALVVGGGELAHDAAGDAESVVGLVRARRPVGARRRLRWGERKGEPRGVGHLAGADLAHLETGDRRVGVEDSGALEGGSEPLGGDVGRTVQEGHRCRRPCRRQGFGRGSVHGGAETIAVATTVAALAGPLRPPTHDRRRPGAGCPGRSAPEGNRGRT